MLRLASAAILLAFAAPATAQTTAAPAPAQPTPPANAGPPPEFMQAAQGFGQCIGTQAQAADAKLTPEAAATAAVAACQTQQTALGQRFESWISGPGFPAAGRDMARAQFKAEMDKVPAQVADGIRKARAGAAAPTAPKN